MRALSFLLLLLCGCESAHLELSPDPDNAHYAGIGLGLDADFWVGFSTCGGFGDCGGAEAADGLEVEVTSGAAELVAVQPARSHFALRGVAEATAEVEIVTNQSDGEYAIAVRPVAYSYLLPYPTSGQRALDVRSAAAQLAADGDHYLVLVGSRLDMAQGHFSQVFASLEPPRGTWLLGAAPLMLEPGSSGATLLEQTIDVGAAVGVATLTTAVGGRTDLQIVDESAVAELLLLEYGFTEVGDAFEAEYGGTTLHLHPVDGDGRLVLSGGIGEPTVTAADPGLVSVAVDTTDLAPRIKLTELAAGTTTVTIGWLGLERSLELTFVQGR